MNILDKIAADKRIEIAEKKEVIPVETLRLLPLYQRKCRSLAANLRAGSGIITEFKRRSPSHPDLNPGAEVEKIIPDYEKAGASGISVLTDEGYFGGSLDDLFIAREQVDLPLLRKDFMIDSYQVHEAKASGADVILLIAALLSRKEIEDLSGLARELGMEVLLEVHSEHELERSLMPGLDMIGVNNRNLKTFEVDLSISKTLAAKIPDDYVRVSESGISSIEAILELKKFGYQGFLVGGNFMKTEDPGKTARIFIQELSKHEA